MKKFRINYYREVEGTVLMLAKDQEEAEEMFNNYDYDNEVEEEKNIDIESVEEVKE